MRLYRQFYFYKAVRKCSPAEFTCRNGICISAELYCNGEDDCHDCGLEDNCVSSDENCLHNCDEDKVI